MSSGTYSTAGGDLREVTGRILRAESSERRECRDHKHPVDVVHPSEINNTIHHGSQELINSGIGDFILPSLWKVSRVRLGYRITKSS